MNSTRSDSDQTRIVRQIAKNGIRTEPAPYHGDGVRDEVGRIQDDVLNILGRALTIRMVDAGSCNGCELEINALGNPYYNIEGLGIKFVASPRHAAGDGSGIAQHGNRVAAHL